jgi:surface protein
MIISFNTGKISTNNSGGLLQQKRVEVTGNGLDVVVPDAGYDGLSTVYVKTAVGDGGSSFKDFSVIGYSEEDIIAVNDMIDDDIAYSKSLYDAWNPEKTSANKLYYDNWKLVYAPAIDTSNVTNMGGMFQLCISLKSIPKFDTSNVTDMSWMLYYCQVLPSLDASNWDVSKVTTINKMFNGCKSLTSLNVSNWDTSNVTDMMETFYNCQNLTEIKGIEDWDTSNVTTMRSTFYSCQNLTSLDLSSWDTSNVTDMMETFYFSKSLVSLDISSWDFVNVTNVTSIFYNCSSLMNLNFGYDIKYSLSLSISTKLTVESLLSVLNGLYDFTGNGETPTSSQGKLTLGSTNLAKLSDEQKAIATDKGWTLS